MALFIAAPFLLAGCIAFLICTAVTSLRKWALPSSLWCVACGPCALTALVGVGILDWGVAKLSDDFASPLQKSWHPGNAVQIGLDCAAMLVAVAAATSVTGIHGWIVRRLTFFLFRLYSSFVSAGVGLLSGCALALAIDAKAEFPLEQTVIFAALLGSLIAVALALFVYSHAHQFRGKRPEFMNPISPMEYSGVRASVSNIDTPMSY